MNGQPIPTVSSSTASLTISLPFGWRIFKNRSSKPRDSTINPSPSSHFRVCHLQTQNLQDAPRTVSCCSRPWSLERAAGVRYKSLHESLLWLVFVEGDRKIVTNNFRRQFSRAHVSRGLRTVGSGIAGIRGGLGESSRAVDAHFNKWR